MLSEFSQVISMLETLNKKVDEQEKTISTMMNTIKEKDKKITNMEDVLQKLIRGLFHPEKQIHSLDELSLLSQKLPITEYSLENHEDYYGDLPTTRQGDALEHRIEDLSASLAKRFIMIEHVSNTAIYDIRNLKNQMEDVSYALEQLAASLFNQDTQQLSWRELRDIFIHDGSFHHLTEPLVNTSKWRYPTTRQGDELECRMDDVEAKLSQLGTLFSLPVNKVSQERVKSSFDLCGNE